MTTFDLTTLGGSNGFRFDGFDDFSATGVQVASAGDLNGDGYEDFIVGAWLARIVSFDAPPGDAYVVFGKASGFSSVLALSSLNGANGFRIAGGSAQQSLGWAISAAGDVNGDGFGDLLVGADYTQQSGQNRAGAAYVIYGKASGFTANVDPTALNGTNGFQMVGTQLIGQFGIALGAGDFNGDGRPELAIAAFREDRPGAADAGNVYLVYGRTTPFPAALDPSSLPAGQVTRFGGVTAGDFLGAASLDQDVNGDGFADLVIGAPAADPLGRTDAGEAYLIFGKAGALAATFDLTTLNGVNGVRLLAAAGDGIGDEPIGSGDFNGDGFDDLVIATSRDRAYVVFGKASGFGATVDLTTLNGTNGFRVDAASSSDQLQNASSVGDVNGDGYDDLAFGAIGANLGAGTNAGALYVLYGGAAARPAVFSVSNITASNGMVISGVLADDQFGGSPAGADVNGDGVSDILVGSAGRDTSVTDGGGGYVIFGAPAGPSTIGADDYTGTSLADTMNALAGNDRIRGLGGDDLIRGGPGTDTSAYAGTASQYDWWSRPDGSWIVKDLRAGAPEGTDRLTGFERLEFSDKVVKIAGLTTAEKLTDAYSNILRSTASGAEATFLNGLIASVGNASKTLSAAIGEIVGKADQTTAVAAMSYQFFLGFIPSKGGFDYLVSPQGPNPNNINSAYYQSFNIENRYINFAVNLGKVGEGAAGFAAEYGAKTLFQATHDAYAKVFGGTVTDDKIHLILDTTFQIGGATITRADYFALYGGDGLTGIGTKAAMVGWLLTEAAKADVGMYANSSNAFLTDLADGAQTLVDLVGTYGKAEYVFNG